MSTERMRSTTRTLLVLASCLTLLSWGCSRSITRPDADTDAASTGGIARVVTPDDLTASAESVDGSLAALMHDQPAVEAQLKQADPNVVGSAVSTFAGRPVVLALTRRHDRGLPARLANHEVMELVVGDITAQSYWCGTSTSTTKQCMAGTLGAIVTDGVRNYWLSNWHVFARVSPLVGDAIVSPGLADNNCRPGATIGTLSRWTPVRFDGSTNRVDCAIARIIPGTSVSSGESAGNYSFVPSGTVQSATIGLAVKKVGDTTHLTYGKVTALNANVNVGYTGIGTAKFSGSILFSPMSDNGDSGSLICTQSGNRPVALLYAGTKGVVSVGCPIAEVYQAIGAHVAN